MLVASVKSLNVETPSTSKVALRVVAPSTSKVALRVVAPSTSKVESKNVPCLTVKIPARLVLPITSNLVPGTEEPIPTFDSLNILFPSYPHKS